MWPCFSPTGSSLHFAYGSGVSGQGPVGGEEGDALAQGLGQQQAVERIFVQRGQTIEVHRVLAGDGKLDVAVVEQPPAQQARLDAKVFPPQGALDGDLPEARGAEEKLVARVVQELARRRGEPFG